MAQTEGMSTLEAAELGGQSRLELMRLAESLGIADSDVMTRGELRDAIQRAQTPAVPTRPRKPASWLSIARRLIASVVEQGLHLPDAAAFIRGEARLAEPPKAPPPLATVTLARIYAAQGHLARAIETLQEVLATEPDHDRARELCERFKGDLARQRTTLETQPPPPHTEPSLPRETRPPDRLSDDRTSALPAGSTESGAEATPPNLGADPMDPDAITLPPPSSLSYADDLDPTKVPTSRPPALSRLNSFAPSSLPPRLTVPSLVPRVPLVELSAVRDFARPAEAWFFWDYPSDLTAVALELRVVNHQPAFGATARTERSYALPAQGSGWVHLEGLPEGGILRAALGQPGGGKFLPLGISTIVEIREGRERGQVSYEPLLLRGQPTRTRVREVPAESPTLTVRW